MLNPKIDEILKNSIPSRHSFFQLEYFVIGKCPTIQSKLRQCLIELQTRKNSLKYMALDLENSQDGIEVLIDCLERQIDIKEIRSTKRKIESLSEHIKETQEKIYSTEEESNFIVAMYEFLIKKEPQKDWDSIEVQKEYWNAKLIQEIKAKLISSGTIDVELLQTIFALPDDSPAKLQTIKLIESKQKSTEKIINNA